MFILANFSDEIVSELPADFATGIYYGWAKLDDKGPIHKMVVSIGWNPFYKNEKKSMVRNPVLRKTHFGFSSESSMKVYILLNLSQSILFFQETHIINKFESDFYGQWLKTIICGFIRPEANFTSLGK